MGTSQAINAMGAPTIPISQARVVFGLVRLSPRLVSVVALTWRKKLRGTLVQALSGISLQTRASSSSISLSYSLSKSGSSAMPGAIAGNRRIILPQPTGDDHSSARYLPLGASHGPP